MGDRAPVSAVGALHSYISSLHPELKMFVWDKYCESGQQWEGSLSDWILKAYSLVQGYLHGHTLSSGGGLVEQRGLAQKRPLADAAASVASGEHARKRRHQSAAGAKGTGPTPAVGMRQTEQQPPFSAIHAYQSRSVTSQLTPAWSMHALTARRAISSHLSPFTTALHSHAVFKSITAAALASRSPTWICSKKTQMQPKFGISLLQQSLFMTPTICMLLNT